MADNQIHTGGGSAIGGNVETGSGDFAGRDSQRNSVTVNTDSDAELWRAVTNFKRALLYLEHDVRSNARQYWVAIALFIITIASLWYLSIKVDAYTKAAQNLSRIATEQHK